MQLPALDVNTIIIAGLAVATLYGAIAGKQRLRIFVLSIYVGIVLAEQVTDIVAPSLHMLSHEQVGWLLLGLPILIFGLTGIAHKKSHEKGHTLANMLLGLASGALIAAAALHVLPTSQLSDIDHDSIVANFLQQYYLWFLAIVPLAALVLGFMKKAEKKH